ncbi:MAG TPA: hypothetical protein VN708_22660 [Terriglobales bacterium]|nr:hypothetical protein [Terriglobales bacterium]
METQSTGSPFRIHLLTFDAQIAAFKQSVNALNATVQNLIEVKTNNTLREHIKEFHAKFTEVSTLVEKIHPAKIQRFCLEQEASTPSLLSD